MSECNARIALVLSVSATLLAPASLIAQEQPLPDGAWIPAGAYSEFHLVLPDEANEQILEAAKTFQELWKATTLHEVTTSADNEGPLNAWLGSAAVAGGLIPAEELDGLGEEELFVKTFTPSKRFTRAGAERQLILAAGSDRALHYAVHHFFQESVGARWLAPEVSLVPMARYSMNNVDYRRAPAFTYRELDYHLLLQRREGFDLYRRANKLPAKVSPGPFADYTLYWLLPPDKFAHLYMEVAKPAVDAWWIKDLLSSRGWPLNKDVCFSNEDVKAAILEAVRTISSSEAEESNAGILVERAGRKIVTISPMPWSVPCDCEACVAAADRRGAPGGAFFELVQRVCEQEADLSVHMLLEGDYAKAPHSIGTEDRVIVQVSNRDTDQRMSLRDTSTPGNAALDESLRTWSQLVDEVYALYYAANISNPLRPHPNLHTIREDLQFFTQYNVKGVFARGAMHAALPFAEWDTLRAFLLGQLMWDPDGPAEVYLEDFLRGYYGAAAPHMAAYLEMSQRYIDEKKIALTPFGKPWWDYEWVTQAQALFEKALAEELDETMRARVEVARLPVQYAAMVCPPGKIVVDGEVVEERVPAPSLQKFEVTVKKHAEVTGGDADVLLNLLRQELPQ